MALGTGLADRGTVVVRFQPKARIPTPLGGRRGFTLIEIMVVVVIIAVLATLAIPAITGQMRSRRTQFAAKEIAAIYRNARMRAMGRGSAVLVRYDNGAVAEGALQMREAVRVPDPNNPDCDRLPTSSCGLNTWSANDSLLLSSFDARSFTAVNVTASDPAGANQPKMDVCFSPLGRAFVRYAQIGPFQPLAGVPVVRVFQVNGGSPFGPKRTVLVMPNGNSRLGTAEAP